MVLEIETPINKKDLVRYKDNYGRENKPYEGKKKMEKLSNQLQFKVPKKFGSNIYKYKNMNITIEKIRSIKKLNSNRKRNTIFGVFGWWSC